MKKLDIIHKVVSTNHKVGILREVNNLLENVNLKIQFQDSGYYNDDLTAKDSKDVPSNLTGNEPEYIKLYEIEDVFEYIKRARDFDKLKSIIKKHEEDKVKIDETIKILTARYKKERIWKIKWVRKKRNG